MGINFDLSRDLASIEMGADDTGCRDLPNRRSLKRTCPTELDPRLPSIPPTGSALTKNMSSTKCKCDSHSRAGENLPGPMYLAEPVPSSEGRDCQ